MRLGKKSIALLIVVAAAVAAGSLMFARSQPPAHTLPEVLSGKDPDLVTLVERNLEAISADPEDPRLWMVLGHVYEANGLPALAEGSYRKALSIDPDHPKGWYRLGRVRMTLGNRDGALEAMDRAAELEPNRAPLRWRLGFWQLDQGLLEQARRSFERAVDLNPEDAAGWWGLARVHLQAHRPEMAVALLEDLAQKRPREAYTRLLLGTAYRKLGRWEEARVELERGVGGVPELRDGWDEELEQYRTGYRVDAAEASRLLGLGRLDAAMKILKKLQRRHPDNLAVLNNLGTVYIKMKRPRMALELFGEAMEKYPGNIHLHLNMANAYAGLNNQALALEHLEHAIALDPRVGKAHAKKANILMAMGRHQAAAEAFEQALRHDPHNPQLLLLSGLAWCELEEWVKGLARFHRAVEIDSTYARAFVAIGEAKRRLGELEEAEAAFKRAVFLNPELKPILEDFRQLEARGAE